MTSITDLKKQVADHVKANKWSRREDLLKGMTEQQFLDKHDVTVSQVKDIIDNTLWPGENRKGDVIFTKRVKGNTYRKVGKNYPEYTVESVHDYKNNKDTYRVVRFNEPSGKWGRHEDDDVKVLVKNVPAKWAEQYALNKVDSTLPKPEKLAGREKMVFGKTKAKVISSISGVLSEGVPAKGFDAKDLESRPVLLFEGANQGVVSDGYMLIHDKKVAENVLEGHIDKIRRATINQYKKIENTLSDSKARAMADEYIKKQRGGSFPKWENLVPEIKMSDWQPAGVSVIGDGDELAWFAHNSGKFIAVNVDKLAFIYKHIPGIDAVKSGEFNPITTGGWGSGEKTNIHSGVLVFYEKGKVKALLMPRMSTEIPESILKSRGIPVSAPKASVIPDKEPAKSFAQIYKDVRSRKATNNREAIETTVQEILGGYKDDTEARDDIKELRKVDGRRYSAWGYEVTPDTIERALKVKEEMGVKDEVKRIRDEADKETAKLRSLEESRSSRSQYADESRSNADTIDPDDPRVKTWLRDPGRIDVRGIDTPRHSRSKVKRTGKTRSRIEHSSKPTTIRSLR